MENGENEKRKENKKDNDPQYSSHPLAMVVILVGLSILISVIRKLSY